MGAWSRGGSWSWGGVPVPMGVSAPGPGGYPSMPCRFPGPLPRGKLRGIWPGGSPGPHPRGKLRGIWSGGVETPRDGYCCRQYASYWNAFLFLSVFGVELAVNKNTFQWDAYRLLVTVGASLSRGVLCSGGLCPGDLCLRGSVGGGLCPGGFCPGGDLCPAGSLSRGVSKM